MKRNKVKMKTGCVIFVMLVFCLGQVLAEPCGDVDSDGAIDIDDALLVAQYYVGLDPAAFDATVAPDELRAITKNGAPGSESGGYGQQIGDPTEGSQLIVEAALRDDPRPLFVLVWGSIGDVAQAVHDAPEIKSKIRVYFIGGPNKKGCADTYNYLEVNHRDLWIIENNSTYRGFFNGGNMSGDYSNSGFVSAHVRGHGALGDYFNSKKSELKMGDTPSVTYVLNNDLDDPTQPGWGFRSERQHGTAMLLQERRNPLIQYHQQHSGIG